MAIYDFMYIGQSGNWKSVKAHVSFFLFFRVKNSPLKQSPGYQTELVIQLVWVGGEPPQQITSLALNSSYGL